MHGLSETVQECSGVFLDKLFDELPPNRELDFDIKLRIDAPLPVRPVTRLSTEEQAELKELVAKEFLRPSMPPYGAPVYLHGRKRVSCGWCATVWH